MTVHHLIREYRESDLNFILDSWHRSVHESPQFAWIPLGTFMRLYRSYIEYIVSQRKILVHIACDPLDEEQAFGWIAHAEFGVHYVYVKHLYRRNGLMQSLLRYTCNDVLPPFLRVSHWGRVCEMFLLKLEFSPSSFFNDEAINFMRIKHLQNRKTNV